MVRPHAHSCITGLCCQTRNRTPSAQGWGIIVKIWDTQSFFPPVDSIWKLWHAPLDDVIQRYSPLKALLLGKKVSLKWYPAKHGMAAHNVPAGILHAVVRTASCTWLCLLPKEMFTWRIILYRKIRRVSAAEILADFCCGFCTYLEADKPHSMGLIYSLFADASWIVKSMKEKSV